MANNIKIILEIDNQRFVGGINQAEQATKNFANSATADAKRVGGAFDDLKNKTSALSGMFSKLSGVLAGAAFIGFARSALQMADSVSDLSNSTGFAIEKIIGLRSAMTAMGGSADDADKSLLTFYQSIDQAAQGSENTQDSFAKLGITLNDLRNLSEQGLFRKTIEALAKMPESAQKTAIQADLLGKSFRGVTINGEFLATLDAGTEKSKAMAEEIRKAAELNDRFSETFKELQLQFIKAFGPMFEGLNSLLKSIPDVTNIFRALGLTIIGVFSVGTLLKFTNYLDDIADRLKKMPGRVGAIARAFSGLSEGAKLALGFGTGAAVAAGTKMAFSGGDADTEELSKHKAAVEAAKLAKQSQEEQASAARKVIDALQKQRQAIIDIGDAYLKSSEKSLKKIKDEAAMILMTEDQREAYKAVQAAMEEADSAVEKLNQKRLEGQGKLNAEIDAEIARITTRRDEILKTTQSEIAAKQEIAKLDKQRVQDMEAIADIQNKVADLQDQYLLDTLGGIERQLKQIEVAENRVAKAAMARFAIENRNLPENEFLKRSEEESNRLQTIYDRNVQAQQAVIRKNYEQSRSFSSGWNKAFREYVDNATNAAQQAQKIFSKLTSGLEDLIVNFAKTGKFEWKNFVSDMLETLLRSQIQQTMAGLFQMTGLGSLFGGLGGGSTVGQSANNPMYVYDVAGGGGYGGVPGMASGGGFGGASQGISNIFGGIGESISNAWSGITDFFGGFFANGGTLGAGKWGIAGEMGPELISGPATITPMGGGGQNVTYNINAVDAQSFKAMIAADPSFIHAVAMQGASAIPGRR